MRTNRVLGGVVAVIVALATLSAVIGTRGDAPAATRGGPVAAVRSYLSAVADGRTDEAARWLDPSGPCGPQDFAYAVFAPGEGAPGVRVDLVGSSTAGPTATVEVETRIGDSGFDPFGTSGFSERHSFSLRTVDGAWRLTGTPWPLDRCFKGG